MTLEEMKENNPGVRIIAISDKTNGINLYAGTNPLPWPDDWPENEINGGWIEDQGVEILR